MAQCRWCASSHESDTCKYAPNVAALLSKMRATESRQFDNDVKRIGARVERTSSDTQVTRTEVTLTPREPRYYSDEDEREAQIVRIFSLQASASKVSAELFEPERDLCPKCNQTCPIDERIQVPTYAAFEILRNGAGKPKFRDCPECERDERKQPFCARCQGKGWIYRYRRVEYAYACSACVAEMRSGRSRPAGRGYSTRYT